MDLWENLKEYIVTLIATVVSGLGGGVVGKKLKDKSQDDKIEKLETEMIEVKTSISSLESEISTNTKFDKQFREDQKEFRNQVSDMFKEIKDKQDKMFDYLLHNK